MRIKPRRRREKRRGGYFAIQSFAILASLLWPAMLYAESPRDIIFGGIPWGLRQTSGPVEPGPNTFSNRADQVWVDEAGRAHLTLQRRDGVWTASEMMAKRDAGYGTYRFTLSGALKKIDPNIVFGFFTWDKAPEAFNREIDIEISRWGEAAGPDAWFTVQPYDVEGNQHSFLLPEANAYTFELIWRRDAVEFSLYIDAAGSAPIHDASTPPFARWIYTGAVPDPGRARLRINMWLFRGRAPAGPGPYEVIVSDFSYEPSK